MEPGSRADNPPGQTSGKLADVVGTLIALLTLIMPVVAIAYFSAFDAAGFPASPVDMGR